MPVAIAGGMAPGLPDLSTLLGATMVGVTASLHCFLMCGPLACASATSGKHARWRGALAYQGGRIVSYALAGAVAGGLGGGAAGLLQITTAPFLPWLLAAALLCSAFDLGKRLRPIPAFSKLIGAATRFSAKFSPTVRAGAIGALTPLLPCGVLYAALLLAAASGSALAGAAVMGAFALGAVPALGFAQAQKLLWRSENRTVAFILRRVVPMTAAVVLIVRATSAATAHASGGAPHCH